MIDDFELNDKVVMKKQHACGTNEFVITRVGADIKIKCLNCDRIIMLDRQDFIKKAKKIIKENNNGDIKND